MATKKGSTKSKQPEPPPISKATSSSVVLDERTVRLLSKHHDIEQPLSGMAESRWRNAYEQTWGGQWTPAGSVKKELEHVLTIGMNRLPSGLAQIKTSRTLENLNNLIKVIDTFDKSRKDWNTRRELDPALHYLRARAEARVQDLTAFAKAHPSAGRGPHLQALEITAWLIAYLFVLTAPGSEGGRVNLSKLKSPCRDFVKNAMTEAGFHMEKYEGHPDRLDAVLWGKPNRLDAVLWGKPK